MSKKSKTPNASAAATVQLDFLPPPSPVVMNLKGSTDPSIVVDGQTYVRVASLVNPPDPALNRYSAEEWQQQLASYRTLGIKSAVHVRTVEGGFHLEDGRHRVLGAIELGLDYVKADIDAHGSAASSAVWRFEANARRKADRPLDQALAWKEMMDPDGANLSQAQVSAAVGVSQATVSRRLRLLDLPRELALAVGSLVEEKHLDPLFDLREVPALFEEACRHVLAELAEDHHFRSAYAVWDSVERHLTRADAASWQVDNPPPLIREDRLNVAVREHEEFRKARKSFAPLVVTPPPRWEHDRAVKVTYFTATSNVLQIGQRIMDELAEAQAKAEERAKAKAAKAGKKVKTVKDRYTGETKVVVVEPKSVEERLPAEVVKVQLGLVERFLKAQVSFPEELMVECLARYVDGTPAIVKAEEMQAACSVLGITMPVKDQRTHRQLAVRLSRMDFLARWKKDRAEALRLLAVALYFRGRDPYSKELADEKGLNDEGVRLAAFDAPLHTWLTGTTLEVATAAAKQSIVDRDAGFKPVVDGAPCDHCDEPARLRKAGVNVCRSEVFDGIEPKALAATRLGRAAEKLGKPTRSEGSSGVEKARAKLAKSKTTTKAKGKA